MSFLSTLSLRRATSAGCSCHNVRPFLSTLSLRRATSNESSEHTDNGNFYPRSPCGERQTMPSNRHIGKANFYPRSPCGERLMYALKLTDLVLFLSTLSLRRATKYINRRPNHIKRFLSTLSLRRATSCTSMGRPKRLYFYPRSPCGERPYRQGEKQANQSISIHALLAESDARLDSRQQPAGISIHALLAESDQIKQTCRAEISISIHALLAESDKGLHLFLFALPGFLSTLSLRRATAPSTSREREPAYFYPRSPCGERPILACL